VEETGVPGENINMHLQNLSSEVYIVLNNRADLFMFFSHTQKNPITIDENVSTSPPLEPVIRGIYCFKQ
jgi:hypothetical protein